MNKGGTDVTGWQEAVTRPIAELGGALKNSAIFGNREQVTGEDDPLRLDIDAETCDVDLSWDKTRLAFDSLVARLTDAVDRFKDRGLTVEESDWIDTGHLTIVTVRPSHLDPLRQAAQGLELIDGVETVEWSSSVGLADDLFVERVTFTLADAFDSVDKLEKVLDNLVDHGAEVFHTVGFQPGSVSFKPGSISFKPGSISFKPGSISFKPGSISFKPGSISFKPGSVSFKPGSISFKGRPIIPLPADAPDGLLEELRLTRWRNAMGVDDAPRPVHVAILDTGIDRGLLEDHPLFAGWDAPDEVGASPDFEISPSTDNVPPYFGHGSMVAGLVAMRAPLARINHEAIRNRSGLSDAYELARDLPDINKADIVVMSIATSADDADEVPVLRAIVTSLLDAGKIVVVADGMVSDLERPTSKLFPADFTHDDLVGHGRPGRGKLVVVRAVDADGDDLPGSRPPAPACDEDDPCVVRMTRIAAGVLTAFPHGRFRFGDDVSPAIYSGWARGTGTSFATPIVAGQIARIMSEGRHDDGRTMSGADAVAWLLDNQATDAP